MSLDGEKLSLKLVYYGPAMSGKTTNLMRLHDLLAPELRGEMMVLETQADRTLFFDLLPLGFRAPSGLAIKCKLYTVPGQVQHDSTRKAVLSRCDGIVFVADSQRGQSANNGQSFENLLDNLNRLGMAPETMPLVIQFNKRDLPDIDEEEVLAQRWGGTPWAPLCFASALAGEGVVESFRTLLRRAWPRLDAEHELAARHGLSAESLVAGLCGPHALETVP
ncbi:MAG: GTPase domain-containing protein [Gammaproteobacteria bacterium]|nr:GTPase domain-containing protein [Gammaproteobacteria bacterium]